MVIDTLYIVLTSIAIVLVILPIPWHLSAWNSATCYMMLWTMIGCIIHLVDTIVWHNNLSNPSPTYCDISTKILVGLSMAIPLSSLCINRRLYNIATTQVVAITKGQKKRDVIIDTLVAVVLPCIFMAVHYTMQGHRYDIVENYGCWPTTYNTAPAYVLVFAPPIAVCTISLIYCVLSLRAFVRRRSEFHEILQSTACGLNSTRYFRLMALASSEMLVGLPTSLFFLITNLRTAGVAPWISWEDTHYNFSHITFVPRYAFKYTPETQVALELTRWAFPFIGFVFFAFFGLAEEARRNYRRAYYAILRPCGVRPRNVATFSSKQTPGIPRAPFAPFSSFSKQGDFTLPRYSSHSAKGPFYSRPLSESELSVSSSDLGRAARDEKSCTVSAGGAEASGTPPSAQPPSLAMIEPTDPTIDISSLTSRSNEVRV